MGEMKYDNDIVYLYDEENTAIIVANYNLAFDLATEYPILYNSHVDLQDENARLEREVEIDWWGGFTVGVTVTTGVTLLTIVLYTMFGGQ